MKRGKINDVVLLNKFYGLLIKGKILMKINSKKFGFYVSL
jgi:hypothetical protein